MVKRTKSSRRWLDEHHDDEFVKRARAEGWRSRAVFKLQEIDERDRLIKQGMVIVDLGAAPGGWAQYAVKRTQGNARVVALDLIEMEPLAGVDFIQGDFREDAVLEELERRLGGTPVDLVLSDMAPNISGMSAVDQPRAIHLAELSLEFAARALREGGDLLMKVFQGVGYEDLVKQARQQFEMISVRKPKASRPRSREVYLLARNHRP